MSINVCTRGTSRTNDAVSTGRTHWTLDTLCTSWADGALNTLCTRGTRNAHGALDTLWTRGACSTGCSHEPLDSLCTGWSDWTLDTLWTRDTNGTVSTGRTYWPLDSLSTRGACSTGGAVYKRKVTITLELQGKTKIRAYHITGQAPPKQRLQAVFSVVKRKGGQILTASGHMDNAETIMGNMDSVIFLGGREHSTIKEISEVLGKETISMQTEGRTRGQSESSNQNTQRLGKEPLHLMVKGSVAQNKMNRDTIQLNFLQRLEK